MKIHILISRCCGPHKNEKIIKNHTKNRKVNKKWAFRQFRLDSKSYNLVFCVFFVFLTDRKCRPLSSFWKSGGSRWSRNVICERQNLTEVFGFWFQFWAQSRRGFCSRIRGVPFVLPYNFENSTTYWWAELAPCWATKLDKCVMSWHCIVHTVWYGLRQLSARFEGTARYLRVPRIRQLVLDRISTGFIPVLDRFWTGFGPVLDRFHTGFIPVLDRF